VNRTFSKFTLQLAVILLTLMATGAACTSYIADSPATPTPPADIGTVVQLWSSLSQTAVSPENNTIVEVWNILSQDFVGKKSLDTSGISQSAVDAMLEYQNDIDGTPDPELLSQVAIEAMLDDIGDPYTSFLDASEYELYSEDSQGKFEGIGAHVDLINNRITITAPMQDAPAEKAGIEAGDVILEVNGESTEGWNLIEAVLKIRGPEGSTVRLLVQHKNADDPIVIDIVRSVIQLESISWEMLPGDIAYVQIRTFSDNTDEALTDTLKKIDDLEALGIVLDLRNNLGGLLSTTINIASQFLNDGLILYAVDGDGKRTDYKVKPHGIAKEIPLVVLVNQFSASASEVLSGALQDHQRAVLVGRSTFGKGSVNLPKRLNNGSGLYFTIGRWYSPNGRLIEGKGLEPDILVSAATNDNGTPQLDRALEQLKAQIAITSR
jgi:carboxyl-terminal processing protease